MGIEQSREIVEGTDDNSNQTVGGSTAEDSLDGRDSPRPSISSEVDLPYVSYTVNRPIGDSPKRSSKGVRGFRAANVSSATKKLRKRNSRPQEIVVVREAAANTSLDPELARIQRIPTFLPIIRGALTAPSVRDPDVLERLDTSSFRDLCRRYQVHLFAASSLVSTHQEKVNNKIRQVDLEVGSIVSLVTDRQRAFARYAEKLSQVNDISRMVARCHTSLNQILETMDSLNDMLPLETRMEPFLWTTG